MISEEGSGLTVHILRVLLTPMAGLYLAVVRLRVWAYRCGLFPTVRLKVPVVSVGNLQVGGTGKTPLVIALARQLQRRGLQVAVLSRGYGGGSKSPVTLVSDGANILGNAAAVGDEPVMLAEALPGIPIIVGSNRAFTGAWAIDHVHPDLLLLDDGFQHLHLHRDVNILLLDARRPFGRGRVLPLGILREPPQASRRADVVILTRANRADSGDQPENMASCAVHLRGKPVFRANHLPIGLRDLATGERKGSSLVAGRRLAAFAGLADNSSFFATLREMGAEVVQEFSFPDHYRLTATDEFNIRTAMDAGRLDLAVTTAKDAVKLSTDFLKPHRVWILDVESVLDDEEGLTSLVLNRTKE
ncbi:MAG: tetraacyldisaccharide 4'-kinase [Deltaproteobacteria bacterium]|nr:tetraacyldisaccharide 4'-kinase [Deltaproteobacteria bacterium]